jgi:hypothetical protein
MFGGERFVRDEGFPHNTTPRVRDLLTLTMFGGERFVRDEGFPHNTTPRVRDYYNTRLGVRGFPMMG